MQMWAHYANNYNGVCIRFKHTDIFMEAEKVNYVKKKGKHIFEDEIYERNIELEDIVKENLLHKSIGWRYENEWRIIKKTSDTFINFSDTCIDRIILGELSKLDPECIEDIFVIASKKNIPLYFITFKPYQYKLNVRKFKIEEYRNGEYESLSIY